MRIVPYDQVRDAAGFTLLGDSAFSWLPTPERVAARRKADPRYRDTYGYCLLDGRVPVGFAGVLHFEVLSRAGRPIRAGGIHCVMTRPGYARRGIARRLLERCHDHFRERGCAVSILFTSRVLVAVGLYEELGYQPLPFVGRPAPAAYLVRAVKGKLPRQRAARLDHFRIEQLFDRHGRQFISFLRDPGWLKARMTAWQERSDHLVIDRSGYAYVETEKESVRVYELVAGNEAARRRLVLRIEALNRPAIAFYVVNDPALLQLLRGRGYTVRPESFGLLMARSLGATPLARLLGPRFTYSPLDQF
jgi:GNAT superfamily N-acetyltransferase